MRTNASITNENESSLPIKFQGSRFREPSRSDVDPDPDACKPDPNRRPRPRPILRRYAQLLWSCLWSKQAAATHTMLRTIFPALHLPPASAPLRSHLGLHPLPAPASPAVSHPDHVDLDRAVCGDEQAMMRASGRVGLHEDTPSASASAATATAVSGALAEAPPKSAAERRSDVLQWYAARKTGEPVKRGRQRPSARREPNPDPVDRSSSS